MAGKFARSWELVKASAAVLRSDRELLLFPLASSIAVLLVVASFVAPVVGSGIYQQMSPGGSMRGLFYLWVFFFYFVQYIVIFFFNTALVGAAMIRLDGGDPTVADGLRIARSKLMPIIGYAAIAATVGMVLRMLQERAGFLGRIVIGLFGIAWTLATAMVVPVLVSKDVGPVEAVKQSTQLLKDTWGENVIGNVGIGVVFGYIMLAVILVGMILAMVSANAGMAPLAILFGCATLVVLLGLALVQSALAGIYSAALYRYATDGKPPVGFDADVLQQAFRLKA